jgi:hypothetical protein
MECSGFMILQFILKLLGTALRYKHVLLRVACDMFVVDNSVLQTMPISNFYDIMSKLNEIE